MMMTTQIHIYVKIYGEFVPTKVCFAMIIKTSVEVRHYRLNK